MRLIKYRYGNGSKMTFKRWRCRVYQHDKLHQTTKKCLKVTIQFVAVKAHRV
jgi:hypothetical protein